MNCGHPKAARQIVIEHGKIVTRCWACTVEKEQRLDRLQETTR